MTNQNKLILKIVLAIIFMTIENEDFEIDNNLINEKSDENILVYKISYKTLMGAKLLRIRFDNIHGFIRVYDGTRYLTLFGAEKYDSIYNRIRSCRSKKWYYISFFS